MSVGSGISDGFAVKSAAAHYSAASNCTARWQYEGSEDVTLWRAGLAFVSSGLVPSPTQLGLILLLNLTARVPSLEPIHLHNLSDSFSFRPHGLHLDNTSQRLYAVSHSATLHEEAIFVFDVGGSGPSPLELSDC